MAIARGAGTEIIRTASFSDCDGAQDLIVGVQHHIYTVLSIVVCCRALDAAADIFVIDFTGWDAGAGASGVTTRMLVQNVPVHGTFVWN